MVQRNLTYIPVVVFTNDNHWWLMRGFQTQFNKYWSKNQPVHVVGYGQPMESGVELKDNFKFHSVSCENYPANRWTNGVRQFLSSYPWRSFVMFLEDYWISEPVNRDIVSTLMRFMNTTDEKILRMDLTADRASRKHRKYGKIGDIDLIETPAHSKYQMSFQAAIWNTELLYEVLRPNEDPWTAEVVGSKRLAKHPEYKVLGTLQRPVVYRPVYRTKKRLLDVSHLNSHDRKELSELGALSWA